MPQSDGAVEAWDALKRVIDPELDESVVALGFVRGVTVRAGQVEVAFRLPTFWCSASFAFIMAEDMREALLSLAWIERAEVRLVEHFAAAEINDGIARGLAFSEVFASDAAADLGALRAVFRRKGYLGRMAALIQGLIEAGKTDAEILALRIADLQAMDCGVGPAVARFLERRVEFGGSAAPDMPAFRKPEGEPIDPGSLRDYVREIRLVRRSVEANGEMCRMLLQASLEFTQPGSERR